MVDQQYMMDIDFNETMQHSDKLLKYVSVKTVDKKNHEGWLKVMDPLSGNLILVDLSDKNETIIVFGGSYTSVDVIKDSNNKEKHLISQLYAAQAAPFSKTLTKEEVDHRERLIELLKKMRLPVHKSENDESLVVCDTAFIYPPFGKENCFCENGIVLKTLQDIVTQVPPVQNSEI